MFDWDDHELANIIWGETSEADDHIVPYPEEIEKKSLPRYGGNDGKQLNEEDTNSKAAEQNASISKPFSDGDKQDSNDGHSVSGVTVGPQVELPSFSTSKTDSNPIDKKSQLDIGPGIPQNQQEVKELGELVGNSWTNIGSFDDLDRILSNDDLDAHASLGSVDDLWPSSKDLISGQAKSSSQALGSISWEFGALGDTSAQFEIDSEHHNENGSLTPCCRKIDAISSYSHQNKDGSAEQEEDAYDTADLVKEQTSLGLSVKEELDAHLVSENVATRNKSINKENCSNKQAKRVHRSDSRCVRDVYDTWPSSAANVPQFDNQCTSTNLQNYPVSVPSQNQLPQDSSSNAYHQFSNPYAPPCRYGSFTHQHDHQYMLSNNSEACSGDLIYLNRPVESSCKAINMTPQEKIEKLRRRQQMRAMLAIQKQQQKLSHKAYSVDYPITQKKGSEDQIMHVEKSDFEADEGVHTLPCYNPGSPNKKDDCSAISEIDDFSAEDTALYQLQDVIARLDMKIRLSMRDSLYRLAQSATQRNNTNNTSSTNRTSTCESGIGKEEINSHVRSAGKANMETETNHIDRVVAHLLFHQPARFPVKHVETPESSTSTKVSIEQETTTPRSLPVGFLNKDSEKEYLSPHGSKTSLAFMDLCDKDASKEDLQNESSRRITPQLKQKMTEKVD